MENGSLGLLFYDWIWLHLMSFVRNINTELSLFGTYSVVVLETMKSIFCHITIGKKLLMHGIKWTFRKLLVQKHIRMWPHYLIEICWMWFINEVFPILDSPSHRWTDLLQRKWWIYFKLMTFAWNSDFKIKFLRFYEFMQGTTILCALFQAHTLFKIVQLSKLTMENGDSTESFALILSKC